MSRTRNSHSATLLADGRVLIAGGGTPEGTVPSAEIFDPVTGRFTPTGSMTEPRNMHGATLLLDGRVLIVGPTSAELYDPSAGTFAPTGPPAEERSSPYLLTLDDGRVLLAGGGEGVASAELYDPESGTFRPTGSMIEPHWRGPYAPNDNAVKLEDGRVLFEGGLVESWRDSAEPPPVLASAELYDPSTETFTAVGDLNQARGGHSATLLADGRVLVAGGQTPEGATRFRMGWMMPALATAEIYDPATGEFQATGSLTTARTGHWAGRLPDGTVLLLGEYDRDDSMSAELFR
jgi:hypothetical protein